MPSITLVREGELMLLIAMHQFVKKSMLTLVWIRCQFVIIKKALDLVTEKIVWPKHDPYSI